MTTKPPTRVLLFWPVFSHLYPQAFQNFLRLVNVASRLMSPDYIFDPWVVDRSSLASAMNRAVEALLDSPDHAALIAFDDDCLPGLIDYPVTDPRHWQVIPRLIGLLSKHPIIAGVGYMRGYPHTTTVGKHYENGTNLIYTDKDGRPDLSLRGFEWVDDLAAPEWVARQDENGLLDVDFCGVPILAVRRDVFETIPAPWFETRDYLGRASTHDIYFCNKARAYDFRIKVDTHIDCGHIIEPPIVDRTTRQGLLSFLKGPSHDQEERPAGGPDSGPAVHPVGHRPPVHPAENPERLGHPIGAAALQ